MSLALRRSERFLLRSFSAKARERRSSVRGHDRQLVFASQIKKVEAVARKELSELAAREGLAAASLQITWTERLVRTLAREGYDHRFGARPLQRVIEQRVAVPLARWRVANPGVGAATLQVDLGEDGVVVVRVAGDGG